MRIPALASIAAFTALLAAAPVPADTPTGGAPDTGFARLKSLVGEWQGKSKDGAAMRASYRLVSNGTALMETLNNDHDVEMVTMYHPDGDHLILTHYCAENNQPRLKAAPVPIMSNVLTFNFLDATNLSSPAAGHMARLVVTILDRNHFTEQWTYVKDGKEGPPEVFSFERKK